MEPENTCHVIAHKSKLNVEFEKRESEIHGF